MTNMIPSGQPKCIHCGDYAECTLATSPRCIICDRLHNVSLAIAKWAPRAEATTLRAEIVEHSQSAIGRPWTREDHAQLVTTLLRVENLAAEMVEQVRGK